MCAQKIESFDVSRKQRAILEWKYAKRTELRQKYLKEVLNPAVRVMPVETSVQRLMALRQNHDYVSSIKLVPHLLFGLIWIGVIHYTTKFVTNIKERDEKLYRTGQVAYADREFKFT